MRMVKNKQTMDNKLENMKVVKWSIEFSEGINVEEISKKTRPMHCRLNIIFSSYF